MRQDRQNEALRRVTDRMTPQYDYGHEREDDRSAKQRALQDYWDSRYREDQANKPRPPLGGAAPTMIDAACVVAITIAGVVLLCVALVSTGGF